MPGAMGEAGARQRGRDSAHNVRATTPLIAMARTTRTHSWCLTTMAWTRCTSSSRPPPSSHG
eukprot:1375255-Alexandrium_andersonii.AAC.1